MGRILTLLEADSKLIIDLFIAVVKKPAAENIPCRFQSIGLIPVRSYLKKRILVQYQGGREVQTGGILAYFEDLNRAPNKEIGPKDFFEIASIPPPLSPLPV